MKIYTKTGDKGTTALIGGSRTSKASPQVEAYGDMDELIANIGYLASFDSLKNDRPQLLQIQDALMHASAVVAMPDDPSKTTKKLRGVLPTDISMLEEQIDRWNESLPPLELFLLPGGGDQGAAYAQVCRTVCRRAERHCVAIDTDQSVLQLLNRLSDYLFTLARKVAHDNNDPLTPWNP